MKKLILFLLALCLFMFTYSQIPNSGFEQWEMDGTKDEPVGWTTNSIPNPPWCYTVEKTYDCYTGQYGARVKTIECGFEGFLAGWMEITLNPVQAYNRLSFGYKLVSITAPAYAEISVSEELPNGTFQMLGKRVYDTIPNHYYNWKSFLFPTSTANRPLKIKVSSNTVSNGAFYFGYAEWIVDHLELSFSAVDLDESITSEVILYPNPATITTQLRLPENRALFPAEFTVFDNWGRIVTSRKIETSLSDIDIKEMPKGSYIVKVSNSNFTVNKKLIIY